MTQPKLFGSVWISSVSWMIDTREHPTCANSLNEGYPLLSERNPRG